MRKNKVKRKSDLLRKFHKGSLRISIVEGRDVTIGKRKNDRFYSISTMFYPRITMRAYLLLGYRITNHTKSLNIKRATMKKEIKQCKKY